MTEPAAAWADALLAARLFAVDPAGAGGIWVRAQAGPVRDRLLAALTAALPGEAPFRKMPSNIGDGRLLGGLDLAATLRAGRPVGERGLLAEADGGVVVVAMAERLPPATAARLAAVLDTGEVFSVRDGVEQRRPARIGFLLLDEGLEDERAPVALTERAAFVADLEGLSLRDCADAAMRGDIEAARGLVAETAVPDDILDALCDTATVLGVASMRASSQAVRVARAAAALAGRNAATMEDAAVATRLVLAPRATRMPADLPPENEPEAPEPEMGESAGREPSDSGEADPKALEDMLVEAARAALPAGLLDTLRSQEKSRARKAAAGKAGALKNGGPRGRPAGTFAGEARDGARLNVIETLRAAAPWQGLRRRERAADVAGEGREATARLEIRREDFRVTRHQPRAGTTTIFVVDASGSAAANRLAEAKGAVELLLAEAYVRRDQVAVIAFRGVGAQTLLPPTRSLVRAKRGLAGLPAGGGTPLAAGIDSARVMADAIRRRGETPSIVLLTDGRANVARDGAGGRGRAGDDARAAARLVRAQGFAALLIDTSVRPQAEAAALAAEMGARYLPLPFADSAALSAAIKRPG